MSEVNQEFKAYCSAFAKFQKEVPNAEKDKKGNRATYATITSILDAIKEPLTNNGLSFSQAIISTESGYKVKTTIRHVEGFSEVIELDAPAMKITDAQALGSLTTYLRRYSLVSVFGIGAEDDDGDSAVANNYHNSQPQADQKQAVPQKPKASVLTEEVLLQAIKAIETAETQDQLDKRFANASSRAANDEQLEKLKAAYAKGAFNVS